MKKLRSLLICLMFSFLVCAGGRTFYVQSAHPVVCACEENPLKNVGEAD